MRKFLKYKVLIGVVVLIAVSCQNEVKEDNTTSDTDSMDLDDTEQALDTSVYELLWSYDANRDSLIRNEGVNPSDADQIIQAINQKFGEKIVLDYIKTSLDTVYVRIADATQLNSQMGSTGAFGYLAEVTYSLTDIPTIHFVHFDFKEGDHAVPGVYSKETFNDKQK